MGSPRARVAVLYNAPSLPADHADAVSEADVVNVARVIATALGAAGFDAWPLPAAPPVERLVAELAHDRSDLVFNLVEGFAGKSGGEVYLTGLLELFGLPYTGCPPEAQALCHSKAATKALLQGLGLPTAEFAVLGPGDAVPDLLSSGPVIVKPEAEDASLGIDQNSIVQGSAAVAARVGWLCDRYGHRALVEKYLPGPEFNVGILELGQPRALPIAEIVYEVAAGSWPILTYTAKWAAGSAEDLASLPRCPARIEPTLAERLADLAIAAFRATGCRDDARVDFRLDAKGLPMILEVNPNPDIGPSAGWARALRAGGRDYEATLVALAQQALDRRR